VLLIDFLHLWLKFCKGIDKYWIVPVRKLFYIHHWGRLIFSAFLCEMELDNITVSRLLLVPVMQCIKNLFQSLHPNLSWLQYCFLLPCVCDFETSYVSGS